MKKRKHIKCEKKVTVNNLTGEILSSESSYSTTAKNIEDRYYKFYQAGLMSFCEISDGQRKIFMYLATHMDYETGRIFITKKIRNEIAEFCGFKSPDSVRNGVAVLFKKGFIRKYDYACYEVNPYFAGKGAWKDILNRRRDFYSGKNNDGKN